MGYDIDDVKWHAVAHGRVRHEKYLTADPALRAMLASIPLPLYVFTNADDTHAEACLRLLGVRDLFKGVITYETMQRVAKERGLPASRVLCKPAVDAFEAALQLAGGAIASRTLFLDDSARNCGGAAAAGLTAVQVGAREPCEGALAAVPDVRHLREVVPELWGAALAPAPAPATANEAVEHAVAETAAIEVVA
jgi:pyrimidine and pyridine-specific 5'-nucleotidase